MISVINLQVNDQELVMRLPESGMGYQLFSETSKNISNSSQIDNEDAVISNGLLIHLISKDQPIVSSWKPGDEQNHLKEFEDEYLSLRKAFKQDFSEYELFNKYESIVNELKDSDSTNSANTNLPSFVYLTRQGDEFRRLSAFRDDNRVQKDGSLRKGSYGTTILDLESATSGVAAVGRYALPNRLAACYVFQIIPPPGTPVLFGTVTPNFGLCGGGVEVYFPNGCAEGSVRLLGTIPEF